MKVSAGQLRHRVTIEEQAVTVNSFGEQTIDWVEVKKVWAAIHPLSAKEMMTAQQAQSEVKARITIRYFAGLAASMRFVHKTAIYNIAGVIPDADSMLEHITIPVTQGINNG